MGLLLLIILATIGSTIALVSVIDTMHALLQFIKITGHDIAHNKEKEKQKEMAMSPLSR